MSRGGAMGQVCDLNKKFEDFFYELEGFSLRAERFWDDFSNMTPNERKRAEQWLRAAFIRGAEAMANDTLETLGDYGTAVAGIDEPKYNATQCFDKARENLEVYFNRVIEDATTDER